MKKQSIKRKIFEKLFPINTKRRNFIRKYANSVIGEFDTNQNNDTKAKMIFRLLFSMLIHTKRAWTLIFKIKKGNLHYGDHYADICYLRCGDININYEEKPEVSIIIPVYNQFIYTYKCIKSIFDCTKDVKYEIIIADDASTDGTRFLSSYVDNINVIRNKTNLKFLKNCNNAAKAARGKYVLFLNNDTQVTKNWLSSLVDLIESDKTIGMVGSKLIFPNGVLQEAGGIICREGNGYNYGKFDDANKPQYNYIRDVDYISGAAIMLSKKLWNEIGGFDELFAPAYCEDSDLAFEVRKRGLRVVYQPKSVVVHFEGVSNGKDVNDTDSLKHYQIENNIKLREKWKEEFKLLPSTDINKINIRFRDRINGKKTILVIDANVPEYDKDAGSKTTFQYLKMFVEKGFVVKFLGDSFQQWEPYTTALQQMGIEVLYGTDYMNNIHDWIIENRDNIDVVYLNRPYISKKYIDFIKDNMSAKTIYYGHDLHFLREKREYEITKDKKYLENSNYLKKNELELMHKAEQVYYPSNIERDLIHSIDKDINVKAINAYIYDNIDTKSIIDFKNKNGLMFVGGFNHRPNVDAVLWFVKEIYPLIRKVNKIPFYIMGSNPPKAILELSSCEGIIVKGYVTDEELNEIYTTCKIVVVPLRYGAGIKGKTIEAMSKGIPMVTTKVGAEGIEGIEKIVPVTDDPNKFAKELLKLYNDDKLLSQISLKEREYIDKNFSTKVAWEIIKNDFIKNYKYLVVTPDGYGDKGDEAMLKGVLNLVRPNITKIVTPRNDLWTNHFNDLKNKYDEVYYKLEDFDKSVDREKVAIIIGTDLIDGTQGISASIQRLKIAKKIAENGGICHIFCSFRSDVSKEIIRFIKGLPENVKFYLRDQVSEKNFINLTRKKCSYFPDLGFFAASEMTKSVSKITNDLKKLKLDYNLIGVNFSEISFRSLYKEHTDANRMKYVQEVLNVIINKIDNPYIMLVCHDTRHWQGYNSDEDYNKIALEYLKKINFTNVTKLSPNLTHLEITEILKNMETVITGRMHLSIAAFKANIIPIVYTGNENKRFSMNDKMHGMFINCIKDDSFVTHDLNSLERALDKIINNYYDCIELLKYLDEVKKKDIENLRILYENNFND